MSEPPGYDFQVGASSTLQALHLWKRVPKKPAHCRLERPLAGAVALPIPSFLDSS
jgi:hypothetical protein